MTATISRIVFGPRAGNPNVQRVLGIAWLPIREAVLCLELKCSAIFRVGERCCPACGGEHRVPLDTWLSENRRPSNAARP
jgi:hypothetical protein